MRGKCSVIKCAILGGMLIVGLEAGAVAGTQSFTPPNSPSWLKELDSAQKDFDEMLVVIVKKSRSAGLLRSLLEGQPPAVKGRDDFGSITAIEQKLNLFLKQSHLESDFCRMMIKEVSVTANRVDAGAKGYLEIKRSYDASRSLLGTEYEHWTDRLGKDKRRIRQAGLNAKSNMGFHRWLEGVGRKIFERVKRAELTACAAQNALESISEAKAAIELVKKRLEAERLVLLSSKVLVAQGKAWEKFRQFKVGK